ncbi:tyrosine--tRNA ligase [Candidatus Uhrbacteria bacterium RIFCSPHIGHO2_12_FULL_60_25]|uniref:Tyrosine--tRNA ligase n=1 Tax=Candidatus Uhrbacteria bacterium RIFCSPHIGHO2_12_FULL_60_25 TaxID=1802399 RepID=A0A1F7UN65_9BACT|nr:MAG: tyrosine--tRNA ligase [Candidatus Uhrbacteria bacterium RIFCSPHIGHO2_02_FULL_60_44]OGL79685.1 MAG: tyrosine--tRNA ligase [Candidatus Uhrbacteria bacterium RIFCSPHIGHO2_12_FULL_60_25]
MSKVSTDANAIKRFLTRGVENVYPNRDAVEAALKSGRRLRVYLGVDPTGPSLHLGHAIPMRKLAELQALGHEVILLIGDFTAMIGDPTDKSATRKRLTRAEVLKNAKDYQGQASNILSFTGKNPATLKYNSSWLGKMSFEDVLELSVHFTIQQLGERDMFQNRTKEGKPVHLNEFLYPLMQAQDSVAMDVDMEVGGNDQTFNMLAGRTLMKAVKGKEKFVLTTKLLVDPSGKKMGKTEGNMIALSDSPEDMYGKVMSWTDGMIVPGFELVTDVPDDEIESMRKQMSAGANPMPFKRQLARDVVKAFAGEKAAKAAEAHFSKVHQAHETPEEMPEYRVRGKPVPSGVEGWSVVDALVETQLVSSKSDARRQVEQGGVKVDGKVVKDVNATVKAGMVIQKGKRHFVRLS